ncbi:MAG: glutamine synthetase [Rhodobacter sp.]|uniref:glutamine synthetase family protein n=1 Tax=Pararhodobacter sp. TaxID=2127056 RepID=UPI001D981E53|nr:glutamine synthetase family protein [Pararhodobacter sp.]MCB1344875.1 glutamine synthetase [Paracoccaceae bacterium]MCC0072844.1 glutamine synthetase [Rhodobacter sp.]HPD90952.1 glutamine synthetase family protein [Pararhodobacter sp.]
MLTLEGLQAAFDTGAIDTVVVAAVDMQGRLMGKRFHAAHFLDHGWQETHCCDYLLTVDMEMTPVPGYAAAGWDKGYGDYLVKPDLATLRPLPWLPGTALVLADLMDPATHADIAQSPRAILKRQIARARALGFQPMMATELEFFVFETPYAALRDRGPTGLVPISGYNEDYHIFQTTKEEPLMRALRNGLYGAGIPVENTKGEAEAGQAEINIRYAEALTCADHHAITKTAAKEIAHAQGQSVTFMAKYATDRAGSSAHVHQSLWTLDGRPAFRDPDAPLGMSGVMRHFLAGQLAHAADITLFLAPYVNSYKRFCPGLFAPTKAVWSVDNRTAGFRVCGAGTGAVRVECRIGGADLNPYTALAALLAAGLDGIERRLPLGPAQTGDAYAAQGVPEIPATLREAAGIADASDWLRGALGDDVVDHYVHAARWEIAEADRAVTDWDLKRGLERA